MTFSTYDRYDAEWESPDTGRTVYRPGVDDDEDCTCTYAAFAKIGGGTGFDISRYDPDCPEHG